VTNRLIYQRREFMTLLGGAAASWPVAARAQQAGKLPTIGILGSGTPAGHGQWYAGFVQRLRELGWTEGRNLAIEYRWAEGRSERFAEIVAEFARLRIDVIATSGTAAVAAAKQATSTIPIVFAAAGDPVGTGLVASLVKPGGNVTGLSVQQSDLAGKRLEILREAVPGLRRLAIMGNAGTAGSLADMSETEDAARKLNLEVRRFEFRRSEDIVALFDTLEGNADAIYVAGDPLVTTNRLRINVLALGARLPTMHSVREYATDAGFISYGPNFPDLFRRAGDLVDKVLRGAKPGDIPVEQPTKFDLVINLITARALRITVPPTLLARADEVIE
jgi:putative tryptophan/tyrosine transport system substrate-binding protein